MLEQRGSSNLSGEVYATQSWFTYGRCIARSRNWSVAKTKDLLRVSNRYDRGRLSYFVVITRIV